MIYRFLLYLIGIFVTSTGFMFALIYSHVFSIDNNFFSALWYMLTRKELIFIPIGLMILILTLFFDYTWHKFNIYRKIKHKAAKKHYKEIIKNDK